MWAKTDNIVRNRLGWPQRDVVYKQNIFQVPQQGTKMWTSLRVKSKEAEMNPFKSLHSTNSRARQKKSIPGSWFPGTGLRVLEEV